MAHLLIDYSERVGFGFSVIVNHYLRVKSFPVRRTAMRLRALTPF